MFCEAGEVIHCVAQVSSQACWEVFAVNSIAFSVQRLRVHATAVVVA